MKILYFTANPAVVKMPSEPGFSDKQTDNYVDYTKLDLWPELKEVANVFYDARMDGDVHLEVVPEARAEDVVRYIERFQPDIVHFSGHGEKRHLIVNDSDYFDGETLEAAWLKETLRDKGVSLLVLNCCWSASFVEELKDTVGLVIGANDPLQVDIAQGFARAFYSSVRDGLSVGAAYEKAIEKRAQYLAAPMSGPLWEKPLSTEPVVDEFITRLVEQRTELDSLKTQISTETVIDATKALAGLVFAFVAFWLLRGANYPFGDSSLWLLFDDETQKVAAAWAEQDWMAHEPFAIFFILLHKPIARLASYTWSTASLTLAIKTVDVSMLSHQWAKKHQIESRMKGLMTWVKETARG